MCLILAGCLAWYVVGRFYENDSGEVFNVGCFTHLAGIEGNLGRKKRTSFLSFHLDNIIR